VVSQSPVWRQSLSWSIRASCDRILIFMSAPPSSQ
jgi:hypothetical protein